MIRSLFLLPVLLAGSAIPAFARPPLLPQPVKVEEGTGAFSLGAATVVAASGDPGAAAAADRFVDLVRRGRGLALERLGAPDPRPAIRFERVSGLAAEAYRLQVTPAGVTVAASDDAGLFYGAVTLWQLADGDSVPAVRIEDRPRFGWRGVMLDSARNFQSPAFVRQLIDWMAAHKLNRLHWHLVDDQGWAIEIRKYPRLTEVGGSRVPASAPGASALPRTGGFYSQAEIRDIVAYAAQRHVTIIPEIEMPGHALSAIRAYPALGTGAPVPAGVESDFGVFPWLYNTDDATFAFLRDVLDEVMELFPSPFIHVGGDEAVKDQWKASPRIQARMKQLGIKDEHALQSWFIGRIEPYLNRHGRKLIGWDEILDGGLTPNATVMSWRGIEGAVAAAKAGHDAILSPSPDLYLNHVQGSAAGEAPGRGLAITLASVYRFDPAPASIPADQQKHILGVQANLWTEYVRSDARAAAQLFPRLSALAEVAWSPAGERDLGGFVDRLVPQLARLKPFGLVASDSAFKPAATVRLEAGARSNSALVALETQVDAEIRYTIDGSQPGPDAPLYRRPFALPLPATLKAQAFRGRVALPGLFSERYDRLGVLRRRSDALKLCSTEIYLRLEDDAPAAGPRPVFPIDIIKPCWIYEAAPMDGIVAIRVDAGQIPFNFQIGADIETIHLRPPATPAGEIEVRIDGCDGERIAVLPLGEAARNPTITTLSAAIAPRQGTHDLCFNYTAKGVNPLWAIDAVQLVPTGS